MEQYVKGFKGFTPVKMCGLSPLASFYYNTAGTRERIGGLEMDLSGLK